jgi:hypothetical protein
MNRTPLSRFDPCSPRIRTACAVAAVVATLATAGLIDALANGHGGPAPDVSAVRPMVVAQR